MMECFCSSCKPIHQWLDSVVGGSAQPPPSFSSISTVDDDMAPTPPDSSRQKQRSGSPSKRRRRDTNIYDDDDELAPDDDNDRTPRSFRHRAIGGPLPPVPIRLSQQLQQDQHPNLPPPSQASTGTGSSRKRSTSPAKRVINLEGLVKPVKYITPVTNNQMRACLLPDIHPLYNRLKNIVISRKGLIPAVVRRLVEADQDITLSDDMFLPEPGNDSDIGDATAKAEAELKSLQEIQSYAIDSVIKQRSEAAWNLDVHGPILQLAVEGTLAVERELITTASIARAFLPPMKSDFATGREGGGGSTLSSSSASSIKGGGAVTSGKLVDFALVLSPQEWDDPLHNRLVRAVCDQPDGRQSICQTEYQPLICRPPAISIETKTSDGYMEAAKVQLGVWTAAWHRRMAEWVLLRDSRTGNSSGNKDEGGGVPLLITLPVLIVVGHHWSVFFACDKGNRIEIVGPLEIGNTATLLDIYILLASLKELAKWVDGPFRAWIENLFHGW